MLFPFDDLREFLATLDGLGELKVIRGADPDLEIGTQTELSAQRHGPGLLFDNIKESQEGTELPRTCLPPPNVRAWPSEFPPH